MDPVPTGLLPLGISASVMGLATKTSSFFFFFTQGDGGTGRLLYLVPKEIVVDIFVFWGVLSPSINPSAHPFFFSPRDET